MKEWENVKDIKISGIKLLEKYDYTIIEKTYNEKDNSIICSLNNRYTKFKIYTKPEPKGIFKSIKNFISKDNDDFMWTKTPDEFIEYTKNMSINFGEIWIENTEFELPIIEVSRGIEPNYFDIKHNYHLLFITLMNDSVTIVPFLELDDAEQCFDTLKSMINFNSQYINTFYNEILNKKG